MWGIHFQDSPGLFLWYAFQNVKWIAFQSMLPAAITWTYTDLELKCNCSCKDMGKHFSRANCTWIQVTYFLKTCLSVLAEDEAVYRFPLKIRLTPFLKLPLYRCRSLTLTQCGLSHRCSYWPPSLEEQNYTHVLQYGARSAPLSSFGMTVDVRGVTPH